MTLEQEQLLTSIKKQLEITLSDTENMMKMIAENNAIKKLEPNTEMDSLLKGIIKKYKAIPNISVLDQNGKQIYKAIGELGNRSDREYYQRAIQGEIYYSNVIYSRSRNVPIVILAIPIKDKGQVVGVIAASLDLSFLKSFASQVNFRGDGYIYIVSEDGKSIYHPAIEENLMEEMYDASHLPPVKEVMQGKEGTMEYTYDGKHKLSSYTPISKVRWGVGLTIDDKVIHSKISNKLVNTRNIIAISLVIAIIFAYLLSNYIVNPISSASNFAIEVAEGKLDIEDLKVKGKDQIATLTDSLNIMKDRLKKIIVQVKNTVDDLSAYSQELAASAEEGNAIVNSTSDRITEIVADIEQISASSQETASLTQAGVTNSEDTSLNVKDNMENTVEIIKDLNKSSNQIGNVVELITDIAEQINLLALNAAIEAARAGENGRGFAVVADEIRSLAEQTGNSTKNIKDLITSIQSQAKLGLNSVEEVLIETENLFTEIKESGNRTVEHINEVSVSSQNLANTSDELSNSSLEMGNVSEGIAQSSQQLANMSQDLKELIENFKV